MHLHFHTPTSQGKSKKGSKEAGDVNVAFRSHPTGLINGGLYDIGIARLALPSGGSTIETSANMECPETAAFVHSLLQLQGNLGHQNR
mmetsp:Transcript_9411/g.20890  ORF Transcript_9411/g.20890 Transcript_9411/m.20890 type:complete len:88 (+) Transcript_9411:478-741(+)